MPVQIQSAKQDDGNSTLDKVLKGLQIAQGVIQIPESLKNIQAASEQIKARKQEQEFAKNANQQAMETFKDTRAGVLSGKDKLGLVEKGAKEVPVGTKGATELSFREGDNVVNRVFSIPKAEGAMTAYQQGQLGLGYARLQKDNEKTTTDQKKVAGFVKRIESAESDFNDLIKSGYNRADLGSGFGASLPNSLQSKEAQRQNQAERNFINAVLRRESGAAISPSEFENAQVQYFPRAGDDPDTVAQKTRNRADVFESLKAESGQAFGNIADNKKKLLSDDLNQKVADMTPEQKDKFASQFTPEQIAMAKANVEKRKMQAGQKTGIKLPTASN